MELAFVVAKVFAIYLIVSGAFLVVKGKTLPVILKDFFAHPAVVYLTGVILVFIGSVMLIQYNVWSSSFKVAVTIFGWLALAKGLTYIFFPELLSELPVRKMRSWFGILGVILVTAGIFIFRAL